MAIFTMRFKGPLMALQGPRIDAKPQGLPIPTRSLVTGLIGAALGIKRSQSDTLQSIQDTLRLAVVVHKSGVELTDYQIADLGKTDMRGPMWSTGVMIVDRRGSGIDGLRQQWRPYVADAKMTLIVELMEQAPYSAALILQALNEPKRPLFLGRTSCPPETGLAGVVMAETDLESAVIEVAHSSPGLSYLPATIATPRWGDIPVSIAGSRNWAANKHSGVDQYVCRSLTTTGLAK